ncbi:unnamed protein product, partial [Discosporangium mesarthrocarpum]
MSRELFTADGARKYLTADELDRFIAAAQRQERAEVRSFCLVLAQTGCRISEALELTAGRVDLSEGTVTVRTMKQTSEKKRLEEAKNRFRSIPLPDATMDTLELVHSIRKARRGRRANDRLWSWGRTQAWKLVKQVLVDAEVDGPHATPKGLRHGFGVRAIQKTRNPRLVQKWLGH